MSWSKIAILLEIFSYFLVTLDLFGKERLFTFYKRLRCVFDDFKTKKFDILQWFLNSDRRALFFALFTLIISFIVVSNVIEWAKEKELLEDGFSFAIFYILMYLGLGFGGILAIFIISSLIDGFINLILGGIVKILHSYKLEGIMLAIGTFLFLISKAISFMN